MLYSFIRYSINQLVSSYGIYKGELTDEAIAQP